MKSELTCAPDRQRFVENSGLKFFIERSIPSSSTNDGESSQHPSKKSAFAFLVMEKICSEVKAVLSYFSPSLLRTSCNKMDSSSPESERLTTEASAPAMNFLAKVWLLINIFPGGFFLVNKAKRFAQTTAFRCYPYIFCFTKLLFLFLAY